MATLYDEQGTEIYAGRGKYSRKARAKIAERAAYIRNDEGNLVVYVPEQETPAPQRASTLEEDARTLKRDAQRLGQQLGLGLDEIEVRRDTPEGTLVAHLKQLTSAVVAGLDSEQAAKLLQTLSYWMLRQDINVYEHEELVRNLHQLINGMRVPSSGAPVLNREQMTSRDDAVNVMPGTPTSRLYNELWVHAFLPPNRHPCRPSVTPEETQGYSGNIDRDGRVWFHPALMAGPEFVCENLEQTSKLNSFQTGRHGIIRVFLPYNMDASNQFSNEQPGDQFRDRRHLPERHIHRDNEPWSDCLQRFIGACRAVKSSHRSDLRLFIHRGAETPQEVIL